MSPFVFLRSAFLLCWFLMPLVGTLSFYGRGHFHESQNVPSSFDTGNVWQQNPFSDVSSSSSLGNVWQDQPSLDPPSPFLSGNDWQQNPSSDISSSLSLGHEWIRWSRDFLPSTIQPGSSMCRHYSRRYPSYCEWCKRIYPPRECSMVCPCP